MGKVFNIKAEDMKNAIDQSVKTSKEIGMEKAVELREDKLAESPNTDDEKIN